MGARCLTENINIGLPFLNATNSKLDPITLIQLKNRDSITKRLSMENDNDRTDYIRKCSQMLGEHFVAACYCAIVGIQVRSSIVSIMLTKINPTWIPISRLFWEVHRLLPLTAWNVLANFCPNPCTIWFLSNRTSIWRQRGAVCYLFYLKLRCHSHQKRSFALILWMTPMLCTSNGSELVQINVKLKLLNFFLLDISHFCIFFTFLITVPCLLTKILKAIDEKLLTDVVLLKQIRALVEEWKKYVVEDYRVRMKFVCKHWLVLVLFLLSLSNHSKVTCLQTISSNQDLAKVKKVLGVQAHDQTLITYWSSNFLVNWFLFVPIEFPLYTK